MDTLDETEVALIRWLSVQGWMFFPDNRTKAENYPEAVFGHAADMSIDESFHVGLAPEDELELFRLARFAQKSQIDLSSIVDTNKIQRIDRLVGEVVSSAVLIPMFANLKYGRTDVGLHEAYRIILGAQKGEDDPSGKRTLQKIWKKYEPVAHFWAAWALVSYTAPSNFVETTNFISASALIRIWAEQYTPKKASEPLLNVNNAVRTPEEWSGNIEIHLDKITLPDRWVNALG